MPYSNGGLQRMTELFAEDLDEGDVTTLVRCHANLPKVLLPVKHTGAHWWYGPNVFQKKDEKMRLTDVKRTWTMQSSHIVSSQRSYLPFGMRL